MNCQYIQQNDFHENYLLGRLSKAEESEYEKHIEGCDSCREELAKQRTLIGGIQAVGRQEMKQQIREQVEELREQPRTNGSKWQMILKIAAVLFIIALIPSAIYYFRTDTGEPIARLIKPKSEPAVEQPSSIDRIPAEESGAKKGEEEETQPSPAAESIDTEVAGSERYLSDSVSEQNREKITATSKMSTNEIASGGAGSEYGAAKIEAKGKIPMTAPEQPREKSIGRAQSMPPIQEELKHELLSKLTLGNRYEYAETEKKKGESVRFETKETPTGKYDALTTQELVRDYRASNHTGIKKVSTAVFKSGQKLITVNFVPSDRELTLNKESNLPQSFDVDIVDRDSVNWEMNWYVNKEFIRYDPSQMEIVIEDRTLYAILAKNNIYKIPTDADTTKAILVEK